MTKDEVMQALREKGVEFSTRAPKADLEALLEGVGAPLPRQADPAAPVGNPGPVRPGLPPIAYISLSGKPYVPGYQSHATLQAHRGSRSFEFAVVNGIPGVMGVFTPARGERREVFFPGAALTAVGFATPTEAAKL